MPQLGAQGDAAALNAHLARVQRIAGTLGGEVLVAVDGTLLPVPAWKVALEVYDPKALQVEIELLVQEAGAHLSGSGGSPLLVLESQPLGERPAWALSAPELPLPAAEIHYTFVDGYMLVCQTRALLDRAVRSYESGLRLLQTPKFQQTLPEDAKLNFSAMIYQDLGAKLAPMIQMLSGSSEGLPPQVRETLARISADTPPSLVFAYAEERRITFANNAPPGALDPASLMTVMTMAAPGFMNGLDGMIANPPASAGGAE